MKSRVACGLVTGNVEGIARRKMRAVGVLGTGALAPPSAEQLLRRWEGADEIGFLGGFGSDFSSGDVDDSEHNFLDRAEQIVIAARHCRESVGAAANGGLTRVVHVGDAPTDVLAARACAERGMLGPGVTVGCVVVATGRYSAAELRALAGPRTEGLWEPVVLEAGIADAGFLRACGVA